ncbi:hypothetical protein HPP92_000934 [Vanilla planifolia]|uniref:Uncharacterized protein n=1 Tax=Vanilla planifolia TaxID=51239 RepID=A0A835SB19_VANPL|nr:hypothetical protein HPP92_000934 [Vanilla planifolia]
MANLASSAFFNAFSLALAANAVFFFAAELAILRKSSDKALVTVGFLNCSRGMAQQSMQMNEAGLISETAAGEDVNIYKGVEAREAVGTDKPRMNTIQATAAEEDNSPLAIEDSEIDVSRVAAVAS